MNNEDSYISYKLSDFDSDIDLKPLIRIILRCKKFVFFATAISSIYSVFYSYTLKPIYKGGFEILVTSAGDSSPSELSIKGLLNAAGNNSGKTQELILKSPSVLKPIYNFVLDNYSKKGLDTNDVTYESWLQNDIKIKFKENSQVLSVNYFNNDKVLIKDALNRISKRYQEYSKSDREREINNTVKFLETQQVEYRQRAIEALREFNEFSIKHGLGDVDGFVTLSKPSVGSSKKRFNQKAGQRFEGQYSLLEKYESQYTDYSSKLKENSKTLNNLKLKIENIRSALKRPNEILMKYRELANNTTYQDNLINSINKQLLALKLEQARQLDPWQLISEPTIEKRKISPHKLKIVLIGFFTSLIASSLLSIIFTKFKGNLYELKEIKKNISGKYIDSLVSSDLALNSVILEKRLDPYMTSDNIKSGLILLNKKENKFLDDLVINKKLKILKNFNFLDKKTVESFDNLFLIIKSGEITKNEITNINKYVEIYDDIFKGWIFVE